MEQMVFAIDKHKAVRFWLTNLTLLDVHFTDSFQTIYNEN